MKKNSELTITTTWHNIKRTFYSAQIAIMTLAFPALFYIGLTHDLNAEGLQKEEIKQERSFVAKMASDNNSKIIL